MSGFNFSQGTTTVAEVVKAIAIDLTLASSNKWDIEFPTSVGSINDVAILSTNTTFGRRFFLKIERPTGSLNHVLLTIGSSINSARDDLEGFTNEPARFAWYRLTNEVALFEWTPIQYWMCFSEDYINIILQGDPSLDIEPYDRFLISYAYIGALESFEGADSDTEHNFGLTVSSDIFFEDNEFPEQYGARTATCVTDIGMVGTRSGTPFQAHLTKWSTNWEFADRNFISSSRWTHKYHMSDIVVFHAHDRERGKLQNVLVGDRSAIFHLDTLVVDRGTPQEKQYLMFNLNSPYSILNNGPNVLHGIAIRRS